MHYSWFRYKVTMATADTIYDYYINEHIFNDMVKFVLEKYSQIELDQKDIRIIISSLNITVWSCSTLELRFQSQLFNLAAEKLSPESLNLHFL